MVTICKLCYYGRLHGDDGVYDLGEYLCHHYRNRKQSFNNGDILVDSNSVVKSTNNKGKCSYYLDMATLYKRAKNIKKIRKHNNKK